MNLTKNKQKSIGSLDLLVSDGEFEQKAGEFLQGQLQDSLEGLKVTVTPIRGTWNIETKMHGRIKI